MSVVNVIEVRSADAANTLAPRHIIDAFDMEQCKVVMRVDAALHASFEYSEVTQAAKCTEQDDPLLEICCGSGVRPPSAGAYLTQHASTQDDINQDSNEDWLDFLLEIAEEDVLSGAQVRVPRLCALA